MPKVPASTVADPFNNYVKDKDQSRVPQGTMHPGSFPSQTEMFMAAAVMDQHGRLFVADEGMPFLRDLKQGDWGNPAELYNAYRKGGLSADEAREKVNESIRAKGGSREGYSKEEVDRVLQGMDML